MKHPEVVVSVDSQAADLAGDPFVGKRLRPQGIRLELRNLEPSILGASASACLGEGNHRGHPDDRETSANDSHSLVHGSSFSGAEADYMRREVVAGTEETMFNSVRADVANVEVPMERRVHTLGCRRR
jgi:hypothetical protein